MDEQPLGYPWARALQHQLPGAHTNYPSCSTGAVKCCSSFNCSLAKVPNVALFYVFLFLYTRGQDRTEHYVVARAILHLIYFLCWHNARGSDPMTLSFEGTAMRTWPVPTSNRQNIWPSLVSAPAYGSGDCLCCAYFADKTFFCCWCASRANCHPAMSVLFRLELRAVWQVSCCYWQTLGAMGERQGLWRCANVKN